MADTDLPDGLVEQVNRSLKTTATALHSSLREHAQTEALHLVRWERRENRLLRWLLVRREEQLAADRLTIEAQDRTIAELTIELTSRRPEARFRLLA